jgi:hypothetical protein
MWQPFAETCRDFAVRLFPQLRSFDEQCGRADAQPQPAPQPLPQPPPLQPQPQPLPRPSLLPPPPQPPLTPPGPGHRRTQPSQLDGWDFVRTLPSRWLVVAGDSNMRYVIASTKIEQLHWRFYEVAVGWSGGEVIVMPPCNLFYMENH